MTNGLKPYTLNDKYDFDESLLLKFSEESSIAIIPPFGEFNLSIKLQLDQESCVTGIGYPNVILRYILQEYMKEDYDLFLTVIFKKIEKYQKFINVKSKSLIKREIYITLANHYSSIKDISSFGISYNNTPKDWQFGIDTDVIVIFEGESFYDLYYMNGKLSKIEMIINYNDVNGFFIKFFEAYRNKFAETLGIPETTDIKHILSLIDMILF